MPLLNQVSLLLLLTAGLSASSAVAQGVESAESDSLTITCYFPPQPELIGSLDSLNALVEYPTAALEAGIEGRVHVRLTVEPDGSASEVEVMRGLGYGLDAEAVRVAEQARFRWPEDYPEDLSRRVGFMLPITFTLPAAKH